METIIIGKPAINIYLPLQEFPEQGDVFLIKGKNETVGNIGATSACLLAKWGASVHFTGVVGNDAYADKIRETFKLYKVNSKFMETDFENGTSVNYNILNAKSGIVTKILYNNPESQLKRFKYDFIPQFAIIDGTDFAGGHALLNNNGSCKTVFYARAGDKETVTMSKRCTWVVATEKFAEMMTKETPDGSAESYVNLYQKIVDASGKSNYIIILNNHKILYCVDGKVKMLPEMKINVVDYSSFDSVFVGALSFCLMNEVNLDDAIKFANTAAAISLTKIGEADAVPELDEVLDNSGLRERLGMGNSKPTPVATPQAVEPLNPNVAVSDASQTIDSVNPEVVSNPVSQPGSEVVQTQENVAPVTDNSASIAFSQTAQVAPPEGFFQQVNPAVNNQEVTQQDVQNV